MTLVHLPILPSFEKQNAMGWQSFLDMLGDALRGERSKSGRSTCGATPSATASISTSSPGEGLASGIEDRERLFMHARVARGDDAASTRGVPAAP